MSTDKHGNFSDAIPLHFSSCEKLLCSFYGFFILPEVNMIGSRATVDVTVDAPREWKQLGTFGKMSGLNSRLFLSFPAPNFLLPLSPCPHTSPTCLKGKEKTAMQAILGCDAHAFKDFGKQWGDIYLYKKYSTLLQLFRKMFLIGNSNNVCLPDEGWTRNQQDHIMEIRM